MNIKDTKASFEYMFNAEVTPFLWGHAGIGKSTIVKQFAQSKGYKFFPFYLGTMSDVGDVLGLATFVKDENGQDVATRFAAPEWLKEMIDYCNTNPESGAVVFLDEFNRARRDILNSMFSFALDKTFHTVKLPKNCYVVAAGNPPTDEYHTTDVNDTALMARFVHIKLEPTTQEWIEYAKATELEPTLVSFIQEQPELLEETRSTFTLPVKVDRRAYERASKLFKVGTPQELLEQLLFGIIGPERLVAYKMHVQKMDKPLTGEDVLAGKNLDKVDLWSNPVDVKSALLSVTCDNVFDTLCGLEKLTERQGDSFIKFLETVPREVSYTLLEKLVHNSNKCKLFHGYVRDARYEKRIVKIVSEAKGITK